MLGLRDLQASFFRAIASDPGGPVSESLDPALLQLVEDRGALAAPRRLGIYAEMYRARLSDVLREDFPRVAAVLGAEGFDAVVCAYLARHPSTHPSVRYVGDSFADFLARSEVIERLPFVADLARLEWSRLAVFDAPDARLLGVDDLRALPTDEWPGLELRVIPAIQLLHAAWPVHEVWAAGEEIRELVIQRAETCLRIWRDGFIVYQAAMDACERMALEHVVAGEPFAAVCAALESLRGPEAAAREAAQLVLRWVEDGILARP